MRLSTYLAQCTAFAGCVAAQNAYIYTIDQSVHSSSTASIDTTTASSILARRRGLSESRYLQTSDDTILHEINHYGGYQAPLFGEGLGEAPGKLFIRISGFDKDVFSLGESMPDLWVENAAQDLKDDFKADRHRKDGLCEYDVPMLSNNKKNKQVEVIFSYPLEGESACLAENEIPDIPIMMSLRSVLPADGSTLAETIRPLMRMLRHFSVTQNVESTVVVLPSKLSKSKPKHQQQTRDLPEEEPLDLPNKQPLEPVGHTMANSSSNHTLPRIIPVCYSSKEACQNTTNSCSGHGSCYEAHKSCFKCKCKATPKSKGSKKTIEWGGAACQKKDISVPFILFASFSVVAAGLVAGAIGMLYNMGSQELPSVLGAGVVGPTAHK